MTDLKRRQRSRTNTIRGEHAQTMVAYALRAAGFAMIQPIATSWRITRRYDPKTKTSKIVGASPKAKVLADFMAIVPGSGRSTLIEVKMRSDNTLSLSDFEPHQINALSEHHKLGGLSLVAVVMGKDVRLLEWPIAGLAKGKPVRFFQFVTAVSPTHLMTAEFEEPIR